MKLIFILLFATACNGCVVKQIPVTPVPDPPAVVDSGTCDSACFTGKQLSCPTFTNTGQDGVMGNADDELCADVCGDFVANGVPIALGCLTAAKNCEEYADCE